MNGFVGFLFNGGMVWCLLNPSGHSSSLVNSEIELSRFSFSLPLGLVTSGSNILGHALEFLQKVVLFRLWNFMERYKSGLVNDPITGNSCLAGCTGLTILWLPWMGFAVAASGGFIFGKSNIDLACLLFELLKFSSENPESVDESVLWLETQSSFLIMNIFGESHCTIEPSKR